MKYILILLLIPSFLSAQKPEKREMRLFQLLEILNTDDGNLNCFKDSISYYCENCNSDENRTYCDIQKKLYYGLKTEDTTALYVDEYNVGYIEIIGDYGSRISEKKKAQKRFKEFHSDFKIFEKYCNKNYLLIGKYKNTDGVYQNEKLYRTKGGLYLELEEHIDSCFGLKNITIRIAADKEIL